MLLPCGPCRCGGKVGILLLDFQFFTADQFFCFRSVRNANQAVVVGAVEMWESRRPCEIPKAAGKRGGAGRSLFPLSTPRPFPPRRHFHSARFISAAIYIISPLGTRSPSRIAKRCKADFQFCTGIVHFLAMCSRARYSSLRAASGLGNDPRVLITFRSDMFSDSIALVV